MMTKQEIQMVLDALNSVAGKGKKCDAAIKLLQSKLAEVDVEDTNLFFKYHNYSLPD